MDYAISWKQEVETKGIKLDEVVKRLENKNDKDLLDDDFLEENEEIELQEQSIKVINI